MTQFFGERWDAPRADNASPVPTPVGEPCLHCREPIEDGDRGLLMPYVTDIVDGKPIGGTEPVHMECDLRTLGNVYHYGGQCRYIGDCHQHETGTWRDQGRELLAYINQQRAQQGMGPM